MLVEFAEVFVALKSGKSVRRKKWQRNTTLTVNDGELVQHNPLWKASSPIQLDWNDLNAKDWLIVQ